MATTDIMTLEQMRRYCVTKALQKTGSAREAAKLCGVTERTIFNWINTWDLVYDKLISGYRPKSPDKCLVI